MAPLSRLHRRYCPLSALSVAALAAFPHCTQCVSPAYAVYAVQTSQVTGDSETVLVPGDPNLTKGMANTAINCLAFLLEAPLTVSQRDRLFTGIVDDWKKKDVSTISLVKDFSTLYAQIMQKTDAERAFIRKQLQPDVLKALRENKNDEGAQWMLGIYNTAHKPIASGNPPLTRQMTDAYTEFFFFTASEVIGEKFIPSTQVKDVFAKILASGYAKTTAPEKHSLNQMPLLWAAVRVAWPTFPEEQKNAARVAWAKDFEKILPPPPSPAPSRTAGVSAKQPRSSSASTKIDYAARMRALNNMNTAYRSMSNSMWENHYRMSNTIATWGGSPYRYVNSSGNPY